MVGMRKPLSILHSSAYANDCASQERPRRLFRPVLFLCNDFTCFAGICGGICGALLDGKDNTVLRFAVIILHSHRPLAVHRWQDSLCFAQIAAVIPGT